MRARSKFGLGLLLALVLAAPVHAVWGKFLGAINATQIVNSGTLTQSGVATFAALLRTAGGVAVSSGSYVTITSGTLTMDGTPLGVAMNQSKVMTSEANTGKIYFSTSNVFMVSENGGIPKPIVDPPGNWTCTIRAGAATGNISTTGLSSTASCVGVEKVISGGCTAGGTLSAAVQVWGEPTGQGWKCSAIASSGTSMTIAAAASCCL